MLHTFKEQCIQIIIMPQGCGTRPNALWGKETRFMRSQKLTVSPIKVLEI